MGFCESTVRRRSTEFEAVAADVDAAGEQAVEDQVVAEFGEAVAVEDADARGVADPLADDDVGQAVAVAVGDGDAGTARDRGAAARGAARREADRQADTAAAGCRPRRSCRPIRPPTGLSDEVTMNSRRTAADRPSKTRTTAAPLPVPATMSPLPSPRNWPTATFTPPRLFELKAKNAFWAGMSAKPPKSSAAPYTLIAGPPPGPAPVTISSMLVAVEVAGGDADAIAEGRFVGEEIGDRRQAEGEDAAAIEAVDLHARSAGDRRLPTVMSFTRSPSTSPTATYPPPRKSVSKAKNEPSSEPVLPSKTRTRADPPTSGTVTMSSTPS